MVRHVALLLAVAGVAAAFAESSPRLVEAAKKEGSLTFFTSIAEKDGVVIAADFEKRYGIKVNVWRASSVKVLQRLTAEKQANRWDFDVADVSGPEMEALYKEGLLQPVNSPLQAELLPETVPAHHGWMPQFLSVFVQAYNTNAVKRSELPKTYADLVDPKWKGRLGVEANDSEWYCGLLKALGPEKGAKLFREIVERNGWSVRSGHTLLTNLVVSGEVPLGLTVYSYMVEQAKQKGAPVDWFAIDPVIGRSNGIGISKKPPHPAAAMLFYEYMLTDAQPLIVKMNYLSPVKKLATTIPGATIHYVDVTADRAEVDRCENAYNELTKKGAK
jgi:iron(III) transport system substrate-binding protein